MNRRRAERSDPAGLSPLLRTRFGVKATGFTQVGRGCTNANFAVHTDGGTFFLRRYSRWGESRWATQSRDREAILFEHRVLAYAQARGIPCIAPIPDRDGETLVELDGDAYALFAYIETERPSAPREAIGPQAARLLAQYHGVMEAYPGTAQRPGWGYAGKLTDWFRMSYLGVGRVEELLQRVAALRGDGEAHPYARHHAADIASLVREVRDRFPAEAYRAHPVIVNHGDYILKNIGVRGDGLVLFDFDCCVRELRIYDLAMLVGYTAGEEHTAREMDSRVARLMVAAYRNGAPMADDELALMPYMLIAYRLRFLLNNLSTLVETGSVPLVLLRRNLEGIRWLQAHEGEIIAMLTA